MINSDKLQIRSLAHIGDAVYELFIREITVLETENLKRLHLITVSLVNAGFQAYLLEKIQPELNEEELEIIRRARNLSVTTTKRSNQALHRLSTAFESLVGYLHLNNKNRLNEIYELMFPYIEQKLKEELKKED